MSDRALRAGAGTGRFWYTGVLIGDCGALDTRELSSAARGQNEMHILTMRGRCHMDVYHYVKANHKLQMYTLNSVSEHFLNQKKVDMPYVELFDCLEGGAAEMARAAVYCAEDSRLPILLAKRLELVTFEIEMARVCHTTLQQLVSRGQQIKVDKSNISTAPHPSSPLVALLIHLSSPFLHKPRVPFFDRYLISWSGTHIAW